MMMHALQAGGLQAIYDKSRDRLWNATTGTRDYQPNPNGFFYTEDYQIDWPSFYADLQGKLIKIPRASLHMAPRGKYKLIFMTRNPREIVASMHRWSPFTAWGKMEANVYFYDMLKNATLDRVRARGDYDVLEVRYEDVMADPQGTFEKIKEFGFPIAPEKSAAIVDPRLYRNRSANVEVREAGAKGMGVFATAPIRKGEVVAEYDGDIYDVGPELPQDVVDHAISFASGKCRDSKGIARILNHSCDANVGVKDLFKLTAMRDIPAGEELCWDYAMSENNQWSVECKCGSGKCRGKSGRYDDLPQEARDRYEGFISEWLLKKQN